MIEKYLAWKATLSGQMGISESLLHLHAGLAIFVVTALLLRKRMRSWIPLAVVVVLAMVNEMIDYRYSPGWDVGASLKDLANTIVWPLILFLLARRSKAKI